METKTKNRYIEKFKELVVDAKDGKIEACIGLLMFLLISPFLLAFYLITLVGRLVAYILYFIFKIIGVEK